MAPPQSAVDDSKSVGKVHISCINSEDSHCPAFLGRACVGQSCEFNEQPDLDNYRKTFANFPLISGSRIHPDFDFVGNRFLAMHEDNKLYRTNNLNLNFH